MCCCTTESMDHLLLHCPVAYSLWVQMLQVFGIQWVMPGSVESLVFVGVIGWGNFLRTYGIWFLAVWCGLFGWKEIGTLLRLKRNRLFNYKLSAKVLFMNGLGAGVPQTVLLLWSFLLPLVLPLKLLFFFWLLFLGFAVMNTLFLLFSFFFYMINIILITFRKKLWD